jgi:N-acetylgalactosamine-N,N'-diacetylbacillosaminyl-diphospho-undecaprenol 4-alpha-N-acetylgalactosaminyltransferase
MTPKPSLLLFIHSLGPGGAERITALLAKELQKSFEVHIALLAPVICYEIPEDISIHILSTAKEGIFNKLWTMGVALKNLITLIREHKIDVVLATLNRPVFIALFAKLLGTKFRLVLSEHTMQSRWRAEEKLFSTLKRLAIATLFPKADAIITVSKGIRNDLINRFSLDKAKITTIYNPLDIDTIIHQSKGNLFLPPLPVQAKRMITAGTLKPLKHQSLLIDAFAPISEECPLIILGEGELRKTLQAQINQLGLKDRVFMPGFASNPYPYFIKSDIFILSSNFEGLPTVILEALACGCAVISTDCPSGPREILAPTSSVSKQLSNEIELAEYGILTPVGDIEKMTEAITRLLDNPDLLDSYRKKSIHRAKEFDKSIQLPHYERILKGIQ